VTVIVGVVERVTVSELEGVIERVTEADDEGVGAGRQVSEERLPKQPWVAPL